MKVPWKLPKAERSLISEAITLRKLLAVNPATSASCEISFSAVRRLQQRFSNLTLLHSHKKEKGKLILLEITNTFAASNDKKRRILDSLLKQISESTKILVTTIYIILDALFILYVTSAFE